MDTSDEIALPVLAGPTGVGKTHFAVLLAERHGLEIVSADSRQVFRGLDVGTAKPTPEEQARAHHHVIDVCEPTETYNLARYIADAEAAIAERSARERRPLVVGGTGLYIRGLTLGIFEDASRDDQVRGAIEARIAAEGAPALHAELARADPEAAGRIHANDAVRIVRALEVLEVTGETITALQRRSRERGVRHPRRVVVLDVERDELDRRIARRTRAMFEHGLIEEVESLLNRGVPFDAPGMCAIGYPQAEEVLRGRLSIGEASDATALETRRYAKRQRTWFRAERDAQWLDITHMDDEKILGELEKRLAIF